MAVFPILRGLSSSCFLDSVIVETSGIVRLIGWSLATDLACLEAVSLILNGKPITPWQQFRTYRPDVARNLNCQESFSGFVADYRVPELHMSTISIILSGAGGFTQLFERNLDVKILRPDYASLFDTKKPQHRGDIYGSGPPVRVVFEDVWAMVSPLRGSVLDFGCGAGTLVKKLRENRTTAFGLELREDRIESAIWPEVAKYITLYNGELPSPYPDAAFDHVVSVEVLEHIPDYVGAVSEIARLARRSALLTTPDISAIPLLHRHLVVPWHILEATHVNFFNQDSLTELLLRFFRKVTFRRIGYSEVNGTPYWVSMAALCEV